MIENFEETKQQINILILKPQGQWRMILFTKSEWKTYSIFICFWNCSNELLTATKWRHYIAKEKNFNAVLGKL